MTEPVPIVDCAADRAEAVVLLGGGVGIAPLPAHHLPPARLRQETRASARRQLRKVAREIGSRAHDSGGGPDRVRLDIARDDQATAEQDSPGMAAGVRGATRER